MPASARRILLRRLLTGCAVAIAVGWICTKVNLNGSRSLGDVVDQFNGVSVYFNGLTGHVDGRTVTADGYNLGLRWQCVEFVKRYYFERYGHRMPDSRGNAKDFFDSRLEDGELNAARGLIQYGNGGSGVPKVGDIVVFSPWMLNPYGHVAIVSRVETASIEIVQQNPGPFSSSREQLALRFDANGQVSVGSGRMVGGDVLGWLSRP
ncbi:MULTISPECIES: CHAP domain-containing protein [Burkholderia]|uniref:Bifunctional glutathionylspermidine synthetase/amidase n=1 Tax=Burkholderia aenigmatica TaxID=2015348 RepID=A0A6J5JQH3_9BURK|nr:MULTISPECIES: CHAP domain-containing protein [Burkholderia]AYQ41531.1 CHAP domain-containing protein [Burkholderia lata]CAB3973457.1 Bifunctional glutathionylspermidine synthetase/amidase [Burkholderia aenigmatica]